MLFTHNQQLEIISAVSRAPSVHNVQPARFHFKDNNIFLIEDATRRIPFGDPNGRDTDFSLGIATEGLAIELANHGFKLINKGKCTEDFGLGNKFQTRMVFEITNGAKIDNLAQYVEKRYSHRGNFEKATDTDIKTLKTIENDNCAIITDKNDLKYVGKIYDNASLKLFRDDDFRAEILSWMRLSKSHPKWSVDGLNYEAMSMSGFEGFAAKFVLGPNTFNILDRLGLGGPLTAEAEKISNCAGVLLLHRPNSETPFESGRYFYRTWLKIIEKGFQAAIMAALADDKFCRETLCKLKNINPDRRIITSFRIGRGDKLISRARIKPEDLIL